MVDSRDESSAFAAFYLAGVRRLAKAAAVRQRIVSADAQTRWFAQVGVPARTYDSVWTSRASRRSVLSPGPGRTRRRARGRSQTSLMLTAERRRAGPRR